MGMFTDLLNKVFASASTAAITIAPPPTQRQPSPGKAQTISTGESPVPTPQVDVTAILDGMAAKNHEKLDWKKSIVDLLKLVGMDSSLSARKELAKELKYSGSTSDSAAMNQWLHKEVIRQFAANGGKVPTHLLDTV